MVLKQYWVVGVEGEFPNFSYYPKHGFRVAFRILAIGVAFGAYDWKPFGSLYRVYVDEQWN